ncbi:MAG TPA: asparagine synthase (glutamine-hydrolyzing) [Gammaproteobacteria bacterium]|nr:asparagine synthase (glutamine-hydrolyzing) [Gammaproteobacteria bacterium]
MCGIAGFCNPNGLDGHAAAVAERMAGAIAHRGPDDHGTWLDAESGIALAHRRLSIIDLSPAGHQPMHSASGRYVIVFNGEVYNYRELRSKLEEGGRGAAWRGHSDTEVILAACEAWGIHDALKQMRGMFAIALWDRKTRTITLSRDRLGEKPLYYGLINGVFLFASELKALRGHPAFNAPVNRDVLALFLRHNYVPGPYTIYEGIYKLSPGCALTITVDDLRRGQLPPVQPYWQAREICERGQRELFSGGEEDALQELERLLRDSVAGQMVADVPLGAFLSGGVDSTAVVALMQAQSNRPVKTFTIGFSEQDYDEAPHARAVARHLGTEHTELYVTPQEARDVIPSLPSIYDEPFADSSQIPTYLVSRMARRHVTVSLSGDGGDELFGGYNRYFWTMNLGPRWAGVPRPLRAALACSLTSLPPGAWNRLFSILNLFLPRNRRYANPGDKLHKLAGILTMNNAEETYRELLSHWKSPAGVVRGASEPPTVLTEKNQQAQFRQFEHWMMALDLVSYLPDDILVKVDRAAMAVGLETRTPFLDHRVAEFAWRLPLSMKIRNGRGKWLLRQLLYKYVPRELVERPKMGFGVPIDSWLRGPLREWAETLLDAGRLAREGYFNPAPIRRKWQEHLSGGHNRAYLLWDVLMFQSWLEHQRG